MDNVGKNIIFDSKFKLAMDYASGSNIIYVGVAEPATTSGAALWQIKKLSYDAVGNVTDLMFASGASTFSHVWNNRYGYQYE